MKSKKLISLLCTAALTASSLAGLAVTASAEDSVLWSNSFDAYPTQGITSAYNYHEGTIYPSSWLGARASNDWFVTLINDWQVRTQYTMTSNDNDLIVGNYSVSSAGVVGAGVTSDANSDDTATIQVKEKEDATDKYISIPRSRASHKNGRHGFVGFNGITAVSGEDLLVSFKLKLTAGTGDETPVICVGNIGELSTAADAAATSTALANAQVTADTWTNVRVVIPASGNPAIYLDDATTAAITTASATLTDGIYVKGLSKDTKVETYPQAGFDDLVIMSVAAGTGATATVPDAADVAFVPSTEQRELSEDTLVSTVPGVTAPTADGTTGKTELDFEAATAGSLVATSTSADQTSGEKLTDAVISLRKADKSPAGSASIVATADGGKALQLYAERFSRKSQAPIFKLNDRKAITSAESPTSVMAFNVMLKNQGSNNGALYLVDNENNVDSNTVIRNGSRMVTFATGTNAEDIQGDITLDADKWYTVIVAITPGAGSDTAVIEGETPTTTRIFVYDENGKNIDPEAQYRRSAVKTFTRMDAGQSGQHFSQQLPALTPGGFNTNDLGGNGNGRIAVIDNVIAYTTTETDFDFDKVLPTPGTSKLVAPEMTAAYDSTTNSVTINSTVKSNPRIIHAHYNGDSLDTVEVQSVEILRTGTDVTTALKTQAVAGDKIFIWNSVGSVTPYHSVITVE